MGSQKLEDIRTPKLYHLERVEIFTSLYAMEDEEGRSLQASVWGAGREVRVAETVDGHSAAV